MARERLVRFVALGFLYTAAASLVLMLFLSWRGVYGGRANVVDMVDLTAEKPFVCRVLLPTIVRSASTAAEYVWSAVGAEGGRQAVSGIGSFVLRRSHAPAHAFEHAHLYGIYAIVALLCFIGFGLLLRALIRSLYPRYPPWVADFAPIGALVVLPLLYFRYVSLMYDPMTLVVFALGFLLITKRLLVAYLVYFPLALLGKETAILLLPVLLLSGAGRGSRASTVAVVVYHLVVFAALKALLAVVFRGNPGGFVTGHVLTNLRSLSNLRTWYFYFATRVAAPVLPIAFLVIYRWTEKPALLRWAIVAVGIPMLIGCSLFAKVWEFRTYYELYPLVVLLAIPSVAHAFGWDAISEAVPDSSGEGG
jgi:hypothetical protein